MNNEPEVLDATTNTPKHRPAKPAGTATIDALANTMQLLEASVEDLKLIEHKSEPEASPKLDHHIKNFKPWALKPNAHYHDANDNQYTTDKHGTLHRLEKKLSKKARHRQEVAARKAR